MNITCAYNRYSLANKNTIYINPKMKKMSTICSNPLMRNTKVCTSFWNEINKFNKIVYSMEYEIERTYDQIQNENIDAQTFLYFDKVNNCNDNCFSTEECKVYDI